MSRPHDGQRPLFPSGNPFRSIFPRGHYASQKLLMLLNSFEEKLAESLRKLEPRDGSSVLSLSWMILAMESLCHTHSDIKNFITELQFPVSDWEEKWIDLYLDDSVKLLDICIAFSSELSRLGQTKLALQYVLHLLDCPNDIPSSDQLKQAQSSLHQDWMQQMRSKSCRLERCIPLLNELVHSLNPLNFKKPAKGKVLMQAVYGVMVKTTLLSSIFAAAFIGNIRPLVDLQVPSKFIWSDAFNNLRAKVNDQILRYSKSANVGVEELEATQIQVEKLYSLINGSEPMKTENLMECISDLHEQHKRLSDGLVLLSEKVDEFFQIVLKGRDSLLGSMRGSDLQEDGSERLFV